jgi:hypothetical protein
MPVYPLTEAFFMDDIHNLYKYLSFFISVIKPHQKINLSKCQKSFSDHTLLPWFYLKKSKFVPLKVEVWRRPFQNDFQIIFSFQGLRI